MKTRNGLRLKPSAAPARAALKDQFNEALSLCRQGRLIEAMALAASLAKKHPNAPFPPFIIGNIFLAQGNYADAVASFERAVRLKPDFAEAHNNMAHACMALGKFETAIDSCAKALGSNPSLVEAHNILGNALAALNRHEKAIASFKKALQLKSDYAHAHNGLGNVLAVLERNEEAIASYTEALKLQPGFAEVHNGLGNVLNALGRPEEAAESSRRALEFKPDFAEAHNNLGTACMALEKFEEAIVSYKLALRLKPRFAKAHANLGNALNAIGRHEEALTHCAQALELEPSLASAHRVMGEAVLALDDGARAVREFEAALKLKPEFPDALMGLARALESQSRLAEAVDATRRAVAMAPGNAGIRRHAGHLLAQQGYVEESRANFSMGFEIDSTSAQARLARAGMVLAEGKLEEALTEYECVLELEPKDIYIRYLVTRVRKTREGDRNMRALIAEAQNAASLSATRAILLHFALGKCYDDTGEPDLAFEHFQQGARLKRKRLQYDAAKTERYADGIRNFFTAAKVEDLMGHGITSDVPIFILGMPRSGTTLLESILASHPLVATAGELWDLKEVSNHPRNGLPAAYPKCFEGITPAELAAMGERYVTGLAARAPDARRIVDKMPRNFFSLGLIPLILPKAKIVHVRRDPVDTCLSNFMHLFTAGHSHSYDLTELGFYYRAYETLMDHWRSVLPAGSFYEIRYEGLVKEPEREIRTLLDYCGLEWDEACLNFHANERFVRTASVAQVRQPLYHSSIGKWRRYEKHLGPLLAALRNREPASLE